MLEIPMSTIPLSIAKYIRAMWVSDMIMTYLQVDRDGNLVSWSGHPHHYGLNHLKTGQAVVEQVPFLEGFLPVRHTEILQFVGTESGSAAHVHLIPTNEGTSILLLDATAEHDRQQKVQQQANELSLLAYQQSRLVQELEMARQALVEEKKHIEQESELKSRFIANLSHELRTPLTSIVGYTELMENVQKDNDEIVECNKDIENAEDYLSTVRDNATHLLSLIDNVLEQTQLEMGHVVLQASNCDIKKLVHELHRVFYPAAQEKNLDLRLKITNDVPARLYIDELRLRQVIINLLNNAIKFTTQGYVKLQIDWQDDALIFTVTDTGTGIAEDIQQRIFTAFQRADEVKHLPGVGLGLAISYQLIELMGGELTLLHSSEHGSTFQGSIQATLAHTSAENLSIAEVQDAKEETSKHYVILLAEDVNSIRTLMEFYLQTGGYKVICAENGQEAYELALQFQPDIVLMDLQMPVMDGYHAIEALRNDAFMQPIIALSASSFEKDKEAALQAGCDAYLTKPTQIETLLSTVTQLLND